MTKKQLQEMHPMDDCEVIEMKEKIEELYDELYLYPGEKNLIMKDINELKSDLELNDKIIESMSC